jgi:hypothetical protein
MWIRSFWLFLVDEIYLVPRSEFVPSGITYFVVRDDYNSGRWKVGYKEGRR